VFDLLLYYYVVEFVPSPTIVVDYNHDSKYIM